MGRTDSPTGRASREDGRMDSRVKTSSIWATLITQGCTTAVGGVWFPLVYSFFWKHSYRASLHLPGAGVGGGRHVNRRPSDPGSPLTSTRSSG